MRVDTYIFNDQAHEKNQMHVLFNQESPYITECLHLEHYTHIRKKSSTAAYLIVYPQHIAYLKLSRNVKNLALKGCLSELNLDCQNPSEEYNMLLLCFSTPRLLFLHG